jgi:tRNA(Ile)-lysidine synthase
MEKAGGPAGPAGSVRLDGEAISGPLEVRAWRSGERLRPFGGPAEKEVREVLADGKVPREDRPATPVVADGEGPLWIVGVRRGDRAPVTKETTRIVSLEAIPLDSAG